jgi:hypothetical protein
MFSVLDLQSYGACRQDFPAGFSLPIRSNGGTVAKALGLTIPPGVLAIADDLIE